MKNVRPDIEKYLKSKITDIEHRVIHKSVIELDTIRYHEKMHNSFN